MKKICSILMLSILILNILLFVYIMSDHNIDIVKIELNKYDIDSDTLSIKITKNKNFFNKKFVCVLYNNDSKVEYVGQNNECNLNVINNNYSLYLENINKSKSKVYKLDKEINNVLYFKFNEDTVYLAIDEEDTIDYSDKLLNTDFDYEFKSKNEEIAKVENNKIIGIGSGETYIYSDKIDDTLKVVVTDLITKPTLSTKRKEIIACNKYTDEENELLDNILSYKTHKVGYSTRASAVEAARFLTLEFKYRIPYFYENGRLIKSALPIVDGEGRYYNEGLYLSKSKENNITKTFNGPAMWGCPLKNGTEDTVYGYVIGALKPNGLDCSGFVSWVLKNGGFDPGDIGAGESPTNPNQMTDLGEFTKLTPDLIASDKIKAGDLFNFWGHISIIIGVDDDNYYVAESLPDFGGVAAIKYPKSTVNRTFYYVVLMDDYYKEDGNYTKMWH